MRDIMSPNGQHVRLAFTINEARARTNGERRWDRHSKLCVRSGTEDPDYSQGQIFDKFCDVLLFCCTPYCPKLNER